MISLHSLSIPRRIVALTMIITASALLLASGALIAYDLVGARSDLTSSTSTLARIVADNVSAAVRFEDRNVADETLLSLRAEPSILAACVYAGDTLFVERLANPEIQPCPPHPAADATTWNGVAVTAPILVKGEQAGTVQLRATLAPAYEHLRIEIITISFILIVSALFALGLSAGLHKLVSRPILTLVAAANDVSRRKDYSIRVPKQSQDELGVLVDSFNQMLEHIQTRDGELENRSAALGKANEELLNANKMKDDFLATLSHELRTPLTAVFGWVGLLQSGKLDESKKAKAIEVIDRNLRAQQQLVDDLLNVSRIITGHLKIRPEWIEVGAVVDTAVDSIRPAATAKEIQLVMDVANRTDLVYADPERLQQVLWNLLTNAVKFTPKGGHVRLECGRVRSRFQISINDTGEGIPAEFIPFLFQRFSQADTSRTRRHGGLGLGLAIVRHIVESHGGAIAAHSPGKGQGATFTVRLPIPGIREQAAVRRPSQRVASLVGLKVMVVEDETDTREMVAEGLEQSGATVLQASSATEALWVLSRQKPDVLVSDIGMPDMDGYQLITRIRTDDHVHTHTIPAVALTAFGSDEDKERSLDAGYQAHLVKPVAMNELIFTIATLAGRPSSDGNR